ncbi:hypothetical protein M422DRAFT_259652 [Sphaerobolus stellatus SS14]|uniref:Unplaced genomic scaffold SPHSTscaffold_91, whole genome shotgun sequence n=1 Tax=Sphaerobolus stellatus (strain SS14) TaxID=990650 RepID=A0A0C9VK36_SPHS4|nr:hypothetical protein M422DRAFT_259652 [Sphaerobolus stellatus SS14]
MPGELLELPGPLGPLDDQLSRQSDHQGNPGVWRIWNTSDNIISLLMFKPTFVDDQQNDLNPPTSSAVDAGRELSAPAVGEDELIPGLTTRELMDPSPSSVDSQQSSEVFAQEHPGDPSVRAHSPQTVPVRVQSPIGMANATGTRPNLRLR